MITPDNMAYVRNVVKQFQDQGLEYLGQAMVAAEGTEWEPGVMALALFFPIEFPLVDIGPRLAEFNFAAFQEANPE